MGVSGKTKFLLLFLRISTKWQMSIREEISFIFKNVPLSNKGKRRPCYLSLPTVYLDEWRLFIYKLIATLNRQRQEVKAVALAKIRILNVDLSTGGTNIQELDEKISKRYIGGRGVGTYLLSTILKGDEDPLSPENPLLFATGPLTGTTAPTGGRYMVLCKSPLTGLVACSNSGGQFGSELRRTGFDVICITGRSDSAVYLYVTDGLVEIRGAAHLWGLDTHETTDSLKEEIGSDSVKIACIGPAGEKKVRFACIINDKHRAAGRSGVGAVMGSKNLKAVVVKGSHRPEPHNRDRFMEIVKKRLEILKSNPVTGQGLPSLGTKVLDNIINEHGAYPTRNFQTGVFEHTDEVCGEALVEKGYLKKNRGCYACPIKCARVTSLPTGNKGEGPEYESGWALGAAVGVEDLIAITEANYLCNLLGMDTISCGMTLACAMELYEKGYIKKDELDGGPALRFGSSEALVFYTRQMGVKEGLGKRLAEGSLRLAKSYGASELSMSVKGQELPAYDPRGVQGQGLSYATSNRGGCHVRAYMIAPEVLGIPEKLDPQATEGKAQWVKIFQDLTAVIDSMGMCLFTSFALGAEDYLDILNGFTGHDYTMEEMMECGERIWNLERLLNIRFGLTADMDTLPRRLLHEAMPQGPQKGHTVRLSEMLPEYYKIRGWDNDGIPSSKTLERLDLKTV